MSDEVAAPPRDRRLRRALRLAGGIRSGSLTLTLPDGTQHRLAPEGTPDHPLPSPTPGNAAAAAPSASIVLKHKRAVRRLLRQGSLGLGEAYADGQWETPDLREVMALAAANEAELEELLAGRPWRRQLARLATALCGAGGRRSLTDRYELGTGFYASWLDPTMSASAAWFRSSNDSLQTAQLRKTHRLCQMLRLAPGMRLLEIGCGWGAVAEVAARDYGVSVLGIARSPAQLEYATRRIARAGLSRRVELRLQEFRDITGSFDRIASVEAFETIGEENWPDYFVTLHDRLRKNGVAGLQVVTIADRLFESHRRGTDFVRRHVLPGAMLPSKRRLRQAIVRAGMAWGDEYWFGRDYAQTLELWQSQFQAAWPRIVSETGANRRPADERFKRMWEYHLACCEIGFRAGWTEVGQILIARNN